MTFAATNPRPAAPASVGSATLKVASFNVENYFVGPPDPTGRGPNNATELVRKRDKVAAAIKGLNADVVGLIELERGTSAVPNDAVNDLVAALNAVDAPNTWAAVATPAAVYSVPVGTDTEIKSGMIYRTNKVSLSGASFTDTTAAVGTYSRAPIAQTFTQLSNSEKFTLVVNHFRSKSCPGTGVDADAGDGQACFNGRRRTQAQAVQAFVNTTIVPIDPHVLIVGDINAYRQEDPVDVFRAAGYSDVIGTFVPSSFSSGNQLSAAPEEVLAPSSQYSFTFNGEAGLLDHAFATSHLANLITGATIWHINA
ncbi:MAG: hypothetical protein HOP19_11035, partial [Acidobacteria bacterium]|nr:hypothetical protein [Acidobacteriota bacterium]